MMIAKRITKKRNTGKNNKQHFENKYKRGKKETTEQKREEGERKETIAEKHETMGQGEKQEKQHVTKEENNDKK